MLTQEDFRYLSMSPFSIPPLFEVDMDLFLPDFEQCGTLLHYKKGQILFSQEHQTQSVQILKTGAVLESSSNTNGLEKGVLCFPTYPIAFAAAIHQQPTVYSVTAFTDATTISVPYNNYMTLMQQNRNILERSLRFVAFDSRNANVTILQNCACSTTEKIYQTIFYYYLACQYYPPLHSIKLTQNLLAILSGVHRTSVAHTIKDLKEMEIIRLEKKDLCVLEPKILEDIAFAHLL